MYSLEMERIVNTSLFVIEHICITAYFVATLLNDGENLYKGRDLFIFR